MTKSTKKFWSTKILRKLKSLRNITHCFVKISLVDISTRSVQLDCLANHRSDLSVIDSTTKYLRQLLAVYLKKKRNCSLLLLHILCQPFCPHLKEVISLLRKLKILVFQLWRRLLTLTRFSLP